MLQIRSKDLEDKNYFFAAILFTFIKANSQNCLKFLRLRYDIDSEGVSNTGISNGVTVNVERGLNFEFQFYTVMRKPTN